MLKLESIGKFLLFFCGECVLFVAGDEIFYSGLDGGGGAEGDEGFGRGAVGDEVDDFGVGRRRSWGLRIELGEVSRESRHGTQEWVRHG